MTEVEKRSWQRCGVRKETTVAVMRGEERSISEIACEIGQDWENPAEGAVPYLEMMKHLSGIADCYLLSNGQRASAKGIVLRFLGHAQEWRGPVARRVKVELRNMCGRAGTGRNPVGGLGRAERRKTK